MTKVVFFLMLSLGQQTGTPVPRPFPQPATQPARPPQPAPSQPATPPSSQSSPPAPTVTTQLPTAAPRSAPTPEMLGVPLYPGSQFIASYDAGRGQTFYLYGSTASFVDLVAFYRNVLKQRGELVFDAPATHEFEVGRFREETMAFPPGVTIKEYKSAISDGYPNPKPGGQPLRFPTVIQIVPATEK